VITTFLALLFFFHEAPTIKDISVYRFQFTLAHWATHPVIPPPGEVSLPARQLKEKRLSLTACLGSWLLKPGFTLHQRLDAPLQVSLLWVRLRRHQSQIQRINIQVNPLDGVYDALF
jgi:hypothetical protein